MTFEAQERALFDLLFDEGLRERFLEDPAAALAPYGLEEGELRDFLGLSREGLKVDAHVRRELLLQRLCRSLPVAFAMASAFGDKLERVRALVTPAWVRGAPHGRTAAFAEALKGALHEAPFPSEEERQRALAFVDVEVGLALVAKALREGAKAGLEVREEGASRREAPPGWRARPLSLAPFLFAARVPSSYTALKRALCPVAEDALYERLERAPLPLPRLLAGLSREAPRLFVARAVLARASRCELSVTHQAVELPEAFASLLQHVPGRSIEALLALLEKTGAVAPALTSIEQGLWRMLELGLLEARV